MKKRIMGLAVLATIVAPLCADASPFSVFGGVGTTGLYGGVQYRESPYFTTQAQVGGFSIDPTFSSGGENYALGIHLLNGLIAEQWHPWGQGFYLNAGVFINGNRLSLQPSSSNTGDYALATPAKVTFNAMDPYFGIGYSQRFSSHSHWSFSLSAGAAYQGTPHVNVTEGTGMYAQYAYAAEVSSLNQSLDGFRWYPVVQAGIRYRW